MFPKDKIIEIFSICDDFSKVFDKTLEQNAITACDSSKKRKYHRDGMMSDSEVMTILILRYDYLKHFHLLCMCKYATCSLKWYITIDSLQKATSGFIIS